MLAAKNTIQNTRNFGRAVFLAPGELAVGVALCGCLGLVALSSRQAWPEAASVQIEHPDGGDERVTADTAGPAWRLDLNTATQGELEMLPGIGRRRAEAILAARNKRGAFENVWQLSEVPGITPALIRRLEPLLHAGVPK